MDMKCYIPASDLDRDAILKTAVYRMMNTEKNAGFLRNAPHREVLDLSAAYYCVIKRNSVWTQGLPNLWHREGGA